MTVCRLLHSVWADCCLCTLYTDSQEKQLLLTKAVKSLKTPTFQVTPRYTQKETSDPAWLHASLLRDGDKGIEIG
jgi:hypothetical protein